MLNLCCRSNTLRQSVLNDLKSVFKDVLIRKLREDVNEIVYAVPRSRLASIEWTEGNDLPLNVSKTLQTIQKQIGGGAANEDIVDLIKSLDGLSLHK